MGTIKIAGSNAALWAAVFMTLPLAAPVRAVEVPPNSYFEGRASPGSGTSISGGSGRSDENSGIQPESMSPPTPAPGTTDLYKKTPDEVVGMDIVDVNGDRLGTVDDLVVDKAKSAVSAVVAVDRIFGLVGGRKIVLPLDTLQLRGNELQIELEKQELKTSPEYIKEYYIPIPVKDQRPIIDFLAVS